MASFEKKLKTFLLNTPSEPAKRSSKFDAYLDLEVIKISKDGDDISLIWNGIKECLMTANSKDLPYVGFIIENSAGNYKFDPSFLEKNIQIARLLQANILYCNASGKVETILPLTEHLIWIDKLEKTDFFLVFEKAYKLFFDCDISEHTSIPDTISELTSNKLLLYPMIQNNGLQNDILNVNERVSRMLTIMKELHTNNKI